MRGETVPQGVRGHLAVEPDRPRVSLDDLVEALAGQRPAAEVEEEARLFAAVEQEKGGRLSGPGGRRGAPAGDVAADRRDRRAADRQEPFLRTLAPRPHE